MKNLLVKQVEANIGGGVRITVLRQFIESGVVTDLQPHQIMVGPFDDLDLVIDVNNAALTAEGYPAIRADELTLARTLREASHSVPVVKAVMHEHKARLEKERADQDARLAAEEAAELKRKKQAVADRKKREAEQEKADAEAKAEFDAHIAELVKKGVEEVLAAKG